MKRVAISEDALRHFRAAAAQYAPGTAVRASRLLLLKDDIAALRRRGVSYRAIGELLTQSGIPASDTCVLRFCRRVLKEKPSRQPRAAFGAAKSVASRAASKTAPAATPTTAPTPASSPAGPAISTARGPRIAKIELLKPDEKS
jgi:hypothetical protein